MKPPPRKLSTIKQLEEHARKTKYVMFFCAALFCCVVVIAAGFKVIGWKADQAEKQNQERQQIHESYEKARKESDKLWGTSDYEEKMRKAKAFDREIEELLKESRKQKTP